MYRYFVILFLLVSTSTAIAQEDVSSLVYFDFGNKLTLSFDGTYIFRHKSISFTKHTNSGYDFIRTGDQSPLKGTVNIEKQTVSWSNNRNLENILVFNLPLVKGAKWSANKRNWKQNYEVVDTGISLITKTGILKDCIQVKISWIANEPDMQGLQEISLYLAPNLGIVKQQHFDNGHMWHEEVLTKISKE
jgi:hypothetical protein